MVYIYYISLLIVIFLTGGCINTREKPKIIESCRGAICIRAFTKEETRVKFLDENCVKEHVATIKCLTSRSWGRPKWRQHGPGTPIYVELQQLTFPPGRWARVALLYLYACIMQSWIELERCKNILWKICLFMFIW